MIALLALTVLVLWTLLVLRIFGFGATLGERTFGVYLTLGALLAIAVAPPLASLVSPYAQPPSGLTLLLLTTGRLALVLAPVAYALRSEEIYRAVSPGLGTTRRAAARPGRATSHHGPSTRKADLVG